MTQEREQELRQRIADMLCVGCALRHPIDKEGRHVNEYKQEAFGSTWDSTSWLPCSASPLLVMRWLVFITRVVEEEKTVLPKKNRKKGIR